MTEDALAEVLETLERGVTQAVAAKEWEMAAHFLRGGPWEPFTFALERASALAAQARDDLNAVRVALGGEPLPDPADPPPARPDD